MKPKPSPFFLLAALALCLPTLAEARSPRLASSAGGITLSLEAPSGAVLPTWQHGGRTWVLGSEGDAYRVRISNSTAERVEVVLTVDGRDAVSGDPGDNVRQRGYLVGPYATLVVDGFRQSLDAVATFRFTGKQDSYGARRGTPENVGVIGLAVFREKRRPVVVAPSWPQPAPGTWSQPRPTPQDPWGGADSGGGLGTRGDFESGKAGSAAPAPTRAGPASDRASTSVDESGAYAEEARPKKSAPSEARREAPRQNLGTQYGESRHSPVVETAFERDRPGVPDRVLGLFYDDARGLTARGIEVYPRRAEGPQPFPVNRRFAPPPP